VGGAYWLLDEIALAQRYKRRVAAEEFQVWTLKVKEFADFLEAHGGKREAVTDARGSDGQRQNPRAARQPHR